MRRSFPNGCAVADDAEGSARAFGADRGAVAVSAVVFDEGGEEEEVKSADVERRSPQPLDIMPSFLSALLRPPLSLSVPTQAK